MLQAHYTSSKLEDHVKKTWVVVTVLILKHVFLPTLLPWKDIMEGTLIPLFQLNRFRS